MRQDDSQTSRIAVLGASGRTGRAVVETAARHGVAVTAVVRRTGTAPDQAGVTEALVPDPAAPGALDVVLAGHDAVISAIGPHDRRPVCTDVTRSAVAAMDRAGVRRLVVVSAHGAAESRDGSPYARSVWALVGHKMRDKEAMEEVVRASGLDWTVVRPPRLSDDAARGRYRTGHDLRLGLTSRIPRGDLADFLVREAQARRYVHRTVQIAA